MNKVFIDCGTNLCQGLSLISEINNIDSSWVVYSFEANAETFNRIDKNKFKNVIFINKAVWIEDCIRNLNVEIVPGKLDDFHNKYLIDKEEINIKVGGATNIMDDNIQYQNSNNYIKNFSSVECVDFSEFIKKFNKEDYIIVKLDVEGAEYPILEKMIEDGTIDYVNEFYIEWHNHILKDKFDQNFIMDYIYNKNIKLHNWH